MKVHNPLVCCIVLLFIPATALNKSDTYLQNATLPPIQKTTALPSIDPMAPNLEKRPEIELAAPPVSTSRPTQTSSGEPVPRPPSSRKSPCNCITSMSPDREELILRRDLFEGYDKRIRPVLRKEDNVTVVLGISLNQLIDIDERNQVMIVSLWLRQIWYNPFLRWNKSYYGGISEINIDPSEVWKPDLILYNNADGSTDGSLDRFKTQIKVNSEGRNMWLSPVILRSSCKITVKYFPFDQQIGSDLLYTYRQVLRETNCHLKIGSWTYDGFHLDLIPETESADTAKFVRNGEWDLIAASCKRNVVKYVCCEAPYPDVTYVLKIRRRTLFFFFNLVIPCLVIVALTILSFYLPPDSGERISLVITNLLAMTVFMLLVAEIIPPTSDEVSIISIFYSCCIFEVGLALIGTCLVLKYHFSNPAVHEMPCWIRFLIIHCLGKFFMRKIRDGKPKESSKKPHSQNCVRTDNGCIEGLRERDHGEGGSINRALIQKQSTIADAMVKLVQAQEAQDREESQRAEWMMAASIMDNIFMWFFLISLAASFLALFFRIPSYEEQI